MPKFYLFALRIVTVGVVMVAIFIFVTGYSIKLVPNEACAQTCVQLYRTTVVSASGSGRAASASVTCPGGTVMVSGGHSIAPSGNVDFVWTYESRPYGNGWRARGNFDNGTTTVYAVCMYAS